MKRLRHGIGGETTRGFTLLELIVSIGLFMVVVTIAMSAYLSLISLNRKAQATNDVVSNLSFVIESMSRSIRTGTAYSCNGGTNCWPNGLNTFSFTDENGQRVTYRLNGGANPSVGSCLGNGVCDDSTAQVLTDPRINVTNLKFYTQGVGNNDGLQPRVLFTVTGIITPEVGATPVSFTIESSATQRLIEIP